MENNITKIFVECVRYTPKNIQEKTPIPTIKHIKISIVCEYGKVSII